MTTNHADNKGIDKVSGYWISIKNDEILTNAGYLSTIWSIRLQPEFRLSGRKA
jgi:hypothetical protein